MASMKLLLAIAALLSAGTPAEGRIYLDASQCMDVACDAGYGGTAGVTCAASTDGSANRFTLSGCSPLCVEPSTFPTGYDLNNCRTPNGAITVSACGVQCGNNYQSTGNGPTATCSGPLGTFSYTGCEEIPSCNLPNPVPTGYTTTNCAASSSRLTESQCTVSCATDYSGNAVDSCTTNGGTFAFSGCDQACTLPGDTTGYNIAGCTGSKSSSECEVTCDTTNFYAGTAQDSCPSAGGTHSLSGCSLTPKCAVPATLPTGYTATGCGAGTIHAAQCTGLQCATDYQGNAVATCSSENADMSFSGCTVIPRCSASDTTGYVISGCDTSGGNKLASECNPTCATNYGGSATPTCASNNGAFTFAGCVMQCNLPATTPTGYTTGGCTSLTTVAACEPQVQCANGYVGTPQLTCPGAGQTMTFSGCMARPKCSLAIPTPGYDTTNCNPGRDAAYGIWESQCAPICADGYTGTAQAVCSSDGGTFQLSGCERDTTCILPDDTTGYKTTRCTTAGCGNYAIDIASCKVQCEAGYQGTASDACATDGGEFTLAGCHPMCVHPTSTAGYVTTFCDTSAGAMTASSCNLGSTCASGYTPTGSGPTATCDTAFGYFTFSGCEQLPTCSTPNPMTTGYSGSCSNQNVDQCNVVCATNYGGTPVLTCASNGGTFGLSGCEIACTLPASTVGYNTAGCTGTSTSAACSVACDTTNFYVGTAQDSCPSAGGEHSLSGCSLAPKCTVPATLPTGYTATGCAAGDKHAAQCTGLQCAADYEGNAVATCSSEGAAMSFSGCTLIPKCTASATTGYNLASCSTSGGAITASACTVTCATPDYYGTATDTCASNNGAFTFGGCNIACTLPTTPTGYTLSGCANPTSVEACTTVGCASGYAGTPTLTCPSAGGTMSFSGCSPEPKCTLAVTSTPGYVTTSCNPGRISTYGITQAQCGVACAAGYTGTASASCASEGATFTFSGCTRASTCLLPSSTTGYETMQCQTHSSCGPTDRAADYAMRAEHPTALLLLLVGAVQWLKL